MNLVLGLGVSAVSIFLIWKLCIYVVRGELKKALPSKLQEIRDDFAGDLKVLIDMKEDGRTKVEKVEEVKVEEVN